MYINTPVTSPHLRTMCDRSLPADWTNKQVQAITIANAPPKGIHVKKNV
jgi:hypothetical protein